MNDSYLEYLDYREKVLYENTKISSQELKTLLEDVENSRKQYKMMMEVVQIALQNNTTPLTNNEQNEILSRIEKMEKEDAEILDFYANKKK